MSQASGSLCHHSLRCGAVLRSNIRAADRGRLRPSVIIPCVAGRFFEDGDMELSPFFAGDVIIPCVAGRFFEGVCIQLETNAP